MQKIFALSILTTTLFVVIATFAVLEAKRPQDWQLALDDYLASSVVSSGAATVQSVIPAQEPWNFSPDMASPVLTGWPWGNINIPSPKEMKCVLLERAASSTATSERPHTQEVVLIGYHTDQLWHKGWIVYELEGDLSTPESLENLAALGCDLGLGP
jgi:hypothetical protein